MSPSEPMAAQAMASAEFAAMRQAQLDARVYSDELRAGAVIGGYPYYEKSAVERAFIRGAQTYYDRAVAAERERDGLRKAYDLLLKGMESQAELMDGLKQTEREARKLLESKR